MKRPLQSARRQELLEATAHYLLEHGVADVSLRPLAAAVGSKARLLIYHFGSRDTLVSEALAHILHGVQRRFAEMNRPGSPDRAVLSFWKWATAPAGTKYLRLIFEVHGLAPRNPTLYGKYVLEAFDSWRYLIEDRLDPAIPARRRRIVATMIIAVVDGLLMDFLATGDRTRTTRALQQFLKEAKA